MKKKSGFRMTAKYIFLFAALLLIVNIVLGIVMMNQSIFSIKTMVRKTMLDISNTAAGLLDGDALGALEAEDVGSPSYQEIYKQLEVFLDNNDILYIYAVRKVGDNEFVFTVDPDPVRPASFGDPVVVSAALVQAGQGIAAVDNEPYTDSWGTFYSAYTPVWDSAGKMAGIVGVDFDALWYQDHIKDHIVFVAIITGLSVLAGGLFLFLFTRSIQKRLVSLDQEMEDLAGDVNELAKELAIRSGNNAIAADDPSGPGAVSEETSGDEIEVLSGQIRSLHAELKQHLNYVHSMAYTDALTNVGNTTAYLEKQSGISKSIAEKTTHFFVILFDINSLKKVNDQFGHAIGDAVIRGAATVIANAFGKEKTYRIGGDEFVVIVEDVSRADVNDRLGAVERGVESFNRTGDAGEAVLSLSSGIAAYHPDEDTSFKEVFIRADQEMYRTKEAYRKSLKE